MPYLQKVYSELRNVWMVRIGREGQPPKGPAGKGKLIYEVQIGGVSDEHRRGLMTICRHLLFFKKHLKNSVGFSSMGKEFCICRKNLNSS